jgi:hypothetical protein
MESVTGAVEPVLGRALKLKQKTLRQIQPQPKNVRQTQSIGIAVGK